ncbi:hypothetical protein, partial [Actinoplanes sp. NPDC049118]|uniref:hypothetical protein n=1 Tax=Actinoplanes sp. NPDC049118 TaxID=3155769 RepID=UPI00340F1F4B
GLFPKVDAAGLFPKRDLAALFPKRDLAALFPKVDFTAALTDMKIGLVRATVDLESRHTDLFEEAQLLAIWAEAFRAVVTQLGRPATRNALGAAALLLFCIWWLDMMAYHRQAADVVNLPLSIVVPVVLMAVFKFDNKK